MALACVRQRRGRSLADCGFCLIFNGFSLYFGRLIKITTDGERLPDRGKNYRGRGVVVHGSRLPDREKRITCHGSRFIWYDLKPVCGA